MLSGMHRGRRNERSQTSSDEGEGAMSTPEQIRERVLTELLEETIEQQRIGMRGLTALQERIEELENCVRMVLGMTKYGGGITLSIADRERLRRALGAREMGKGERET